jgi:hypothetical protein
LPTVRTTWSGRWTVRIVTTIAGTGEQGTPATAARHCPLLSYPESLAMDGTGRIYVGDEHNYRIRVVDIDGTITHFPEVCRDRLPGRRDEDRMRPQPANMVLRADGSMLLTDRSGRL